MSINYYGICILQMSSVLRASQVAFMVKNLPTNEGDIRDAGSICGSGGSPGGGHGHPLQYSLLENPMDRGAGGPCKESDMTEVTQHTHSTSCLGNPLGREAWRATVHGVIKESDKT